MVGFDQGVMSAGTPVAGTGRLPMDRPDVTISTSETYIGPGRTKLAWGAVIAGALTALSLLVLSSALAFACDVPAFRGGVYGFGAGVWSVITAAIAFFFGGMVVSYLTPRGEERVGLLHGVLAWVLAVNLTAVLTVNGVGWLHGYMPSDIMRVMTPTDSGSLTAAGWGLFISLAVGLIAAAFGGIAGYSGMNSVRVTK